jgi:1-phosphatidylinositol-4-phosphate 5-kinase
VSYQLSQQHLGECCSPAATTAGSSDFSTAMSESRLISYLRRLFAPQTCVQFTDFSPQRFANIRALSDVDSTQFYSSLRQTTMPNFSGGRSGAFVFFTADQRYLVKTTTAEELGTLLSLLPDYESYLARERSKGRRSLLTRYLGAHRVVMYDIPLYFLVMQNLCPLQLDERYDLKGSWVRRHGSQRKQDPALARPKKVLSKALDGSNNGTSANAQAGPSTRSEDCPLFLDNDLQNSFLLRPEDSRRIAQQLDRDTRFLERTAVYLTTFHLD